MVTQPISICATGLEAKVRTVNFEYTPGKNLSLAQLSVLAVKDKTYPSKETQPLWAIENPGEDWFMDEISLFWRIVSPDTSADECIRLVQSPSLGLPAFYESGLITTGTGFSDSMAANRVPGLTLEATYDLGHTLGNPIQEDFEASVRWKEFAAKPETLPLIPNLMWTDTAASWMTGTKSRLSGNSDSSFGEVLNYERKVRYDYRYGILAYVVVGLWFVLVVLSVALVSFGSRLSVARVRRMVNRLSVGRAFILLKASNGLNDPSMELPTRAWIREVGETRLALGGEKECDGNSSHSVLMLERDK
jgi:hypothetical protein